MNNYYFTFGEVHLFQNEFSLKDYYVRVIATNAYKARNIFMELFSSKYTGGKHKFSFQYEENTFDKSFFPKGEYCLIEEGKGITSNLNVL